MSEYEELLSNSPSPELLSDSVTLSPFSELSLNFVGAVSSNLMRNPRSRDYPELIALAFWMRRANLLKLQDMFERSSSGMLLVPRGTVFHISPSNVDTIFVYSWFLSLLSGNRNIVRLSSKITPQTELLLQTISQVLTNEGHVEIASRTILLRYKPDTQLTTRLSGVCDVRVIWGGDNTVGEIRKIPLPATSIEVAFANKYSLAILKASFWLSINEEKKEELIEQFYNDTYWFDQMACSSPRMFLWVGSRADVGRSQADFWPRFELFISEKHDRFIDADYINKLVASDVLAIEEEVSVKQCGTNDLVRIWMEKPSLHENEHCGAGLFFESRLNTLDEICGVLNRKVQTVSYSGFDQEELKAFVKRSSLSGIDRFVPFGRALDFSLVWDGFDLIRVFMREITIS